MRIDIGDTDTRALARAKLATNKLLSLLIEHHGEGSEVGPVDDVQVELLEQELVDPNIIEPSISAIKDSWIDRQLALHPPVKKHWFRVLEDLGRAKGGPAVEEIQRAVLVEFPMVTLKALNSDTRTQAVVRPRQIAMYLAKSLNTARSLPDIGRRFGGRDHTTVLHAVRKIAGLIQSDPVMAAQIERIKGSLAETAA